MATGVRVGATVVLAVGVGTAVPDAAGAACAAERVMKTTDAVKALRLLFFEPPPPISSVALAPILWAPTEAPAGTENVAEKLPLPAVWTEGIPAEFESHES